VRTCLGIALSDELTVLKPIRAPSRAPKCATELENFPVVVPSSPPSMRPPGGEQASTPFSAPGSRARQGSAPEPQLPCELRALLAGLEPLVVRAEQAAAERAPREA